MALTAAQGGNLTTPRGFDLNVGRLQPGGAAFDSGLMYVPPGRDTFAVTIKGAPSGGAAPTLTVKIYQTNDGDNAADSVDRSVTSPTALQTMAAAASAIVSDTVVCSWVRVTIACTLGECDVSAVAGVR